MNTKVFLNRASWVILVFLLIPAGAVQASKDAVPGDQVYPIKLILEDALLLVMKPSSAVTSDIEMKFTKRRLLEVEQVADTPFVIKSLKSLHEQVTDTTNSIEKVKNLDKQAELVDEYIQTLQETQTSLEQQKHVLASRTNTGNINNTNTKVVNNYYYNTTTNTTTNYNTAPNQNDDLVQQESVSPTYVVPPEEVQEKIEEVQEEIAEEIKKLEEVAEENIQQQQQEAAAQAAQEQQQQQEQVAPAVVVEEEQEQDAVELRGNSAEHRQDRERDDD